MLSSRRISWDEELELLADGPVGREKLRELNEMACRGAAALPRRRCGRPAIAGLLLEAAGVERHVGARGPRAAPEGWREPARGSPRGARAGLARSFSKELRAGAPRSAAIVARPRPPASRRARRRRLRRAPRAPRSPPRRIRRRSRLDREELRGSAGGRAPRAGALDRDSARTARQPGPAGASEQARRPDHVAARGGRALEDAARPRPCRGNVAREDAPENGLERQPPISRVLDDEVAGTDC